MLWTLVLYPTAAPQPEGLLATFPWALQVSCRCILTIINLWVSLHIFPFPLLGCHSGRGWSGRTQHSPICQSSHLDKPELPSPWPLGQPRISQRRSSCRWFPLVLALLSVGLHSCSLHLTVQRRTHTAALVSVVLGFRYGAIHVLSYIHKDSDFKGSCLFLGRSAWSESTTYKRLKQPSLPTPQIHCWKQFTTIWFGNFTSVFTTRIGV